MSFEIPTELKQKISSDLAWHYRVVPKEIIENQLILFGDHKQDTWLIEEELSAILGEVIKVEKIDSLEINQLLGKYYRGNSNQENQLLFDAKTDFVDRLIQEANNIGSSDIHIEVYADKARVRMRIDGHLIQRYIISKEDYPELINKIKIRSNLDISEKRLPQDGRINYYSFDLRVSILPTLHGEKIVLRILGQDASFLQMDQLGFSDSELRYYLEGVKKPNGIILISGPTGSGKTTTLYATLKMLNDEKRNILTVEDPIEYTLEGINQVQLKESIGLTFSSALRSFLRQDPDVIMLGEIRDSETAQMAIRAALTGHLVLSTIHTNSAWGTISRLIDMGVPPFLLANTINTSVAQRLVRKLCTVCKSKAPLHEAELPLGVSEKIGIHFHYTPVGCESCHYTGYKGRIALYEVVPIDHTLAERIKSNDNYIEDILEQRKIINLANRALQLMTAGETSLEEVYSLLTDL